MSDDVIGARVLAVKPHPDQATNNPGCWAVQLEVTHGRCKRSFWRWHNVRELRGGCYVTPSNEKKPTHEEVLVEFWEDTFAGLHGFDFDRVAEDP